MPARVKAALVSTIAAAMAAVLLPAASAAAAPINPPSRLIGTADCGPDGSFSFVVNSGNAQGTTWSPAFVTRSDGARGLFHPASFDLTFTSPFGSDTEVASKPTAPGPVSCSISGTPVAFPDASLTGTVTGAITWHG
jgi:opacity protein-like surface antigen